MTTTPTADGAELATVRREPETAYVMRLATVYLVVPHDAQATVEYASRVIAALEEDPRVISATVPELDAAWSPQYTVYPPFNEGEDTSDALDGRKHVHVQRFSEPIGIEVRVPAKNQPKVFDVDEIPTEHYFVLWDGEALLVAWEQSASASVGGSGGHIVERILEQAAERAGAEILVQACNPQCTYVFIHTAIRAIVDETAAGWAFARSLDNRSLIDAIVPKGDSLIEVAVGVWWRVRGSLQNFARMKNRGRQVLELERIVRGDLDRLNRLHHERARAAQQGRFARIRSLWTFRAWRNTSRYHLARLWLGLGSLERLRRQWSDDAINFRRTSEEENVQDLFTIDTHDEIALVERLDLKLVESAVEHAGDRLSANVLAYATAGGAVAGGLAAAVINAL